MSEITLALEHPSLGYGEIIARYDLSEIQEKAYQQGAREFAEWLTCYAFDHIDYVCYGHFINRQGRQISVDEILDEWQKGEE